MNLRAIAFDGLDVLVGRLVLPLVSQVHMEVGVLGRKRFLKTEIICNIVMVCVKAFSRNINKPK